ncbi:hypothetical protein MGU_08418 [Metarhizium guizhouense ARSEF 977]|uniref:Uncharacterized protein n=1 Tax=Metarhizium guizhouense (strain ARSEF 977) TaxID=1276136 RepID=A0A0B4GX90_METGA|nr:hypothetical protein MGU_08418 [Metarhizium guizhouense ARSEF 977]
MKLISLVVGLFAAGACCQESSSPYLRPDQSEERKRDLLSKLKPGLNLILSNARYESDFKEATCEPHWNFWNLLHTDFVNVTVFEDISKVDYDLAINTEVIRRVDNDQRSGTMQLNTQKSTINIDSTTWGWNIGGQINAGFWSPYTGNMAGITITGGYSRSNTKTTEKTISEGTVSPCEAKYSCWTEAWTVKLILRGACKTEEIMRNENGDKLWSTEKCPTTIFDEGPFECAQWAHWKDESCERVKEKIDCTVETPLLDSDGKTPFHLELAFRLPILPLWEKPQIIGYKAGRYLLKAGEQGYTEYDPDQQIAKYMDASKRWHYYEAYPTLDDQVGKYEHPHPVIKSVKNRCYDLDSAEWYCPDRTGEDKFYTQDKGYYAKPGAPVPSFEEMDRADRRQWHVSQNREVCHDKGRKCGWFGRPPACGVDYHRVGAVDSFSEGDTSFDMTYIGKFKSNDRVQCEQWLGKGSGCCDTQREPCESGFWRLWCVEDAKAESEEMDNDINSV